MMRGDGLTAALLLAVLFGCGGRDRRTPAEGLKGSSWSLSADTIRSEMDGKVRYKVTLTGSGKEGPEGSPRTEAVLLKAKCGDGPPGLTLLTDQDLGNGAVDLRIKVDTQPAATMPGFAGPFAGANTRGGLVLFQDMHAGLDKLKGHRRALIEYRDPRASMHVTVAEFDLARFDARLAEYDAICAGNLSR